MNPMMQQQNQQPGPQMEEGQVEPGYSPEEGMEGEVPEIDGEELQMLLFSRVKQLSQPEMQILDSIITPQTVPVLFKLFPELGILFDQGSQLRQQGGAQPPAAGGGMPQMPQQGQGGQPQQYEQEEENPLVSGGNVSRGLMR